MNKRNVWIAVTSVVFFTVFSVSSKCEVKDSLDINSVQAQEMPALQFPFLGAQIFIEPGQTAEEIDTWFRQLEENHFTVCRIRMFESYMKKANGKWDFSLFDNAFRSAEKHGIRVFGTIFPYTDKTDIGGFKFPRDDAHLQSIAFFIKELTTHFKQYKSL